MSDTASLPSLTERFTADLMALLDRYNADPDFGYELKWDLELIETDPVYDPATDQHRRNHRRGPRTDFRLTIRDKGKA